MTDAGEKAKFATWIKNRIADYDFVENQDFVCVPQKNGTQRAVRICGKSRLYLVPQKNGARGWWYEFVENQDFIKLNKKIELSKSGTPL